jgi:hypothetical protein
LEGDEGQAEHAREGIREINRILAANGLPPHVEPERLPPFHDRSKALGFPSYSMIHYLRRAVAFALNAPAQFTPVTEEEDPSEHPLVEDEVYMLRSHLICHSDCGGFYAPVDFEEPLFDDREDTVIAGILGSSQRAIAELVLVAPLLGIRLMNGTLPDSVAGEINGERDGPLSTERYVWLKLFETFRRSVEQGAVVTFE